MVLDNYKLNIVALLLLLLVTPKTMAQQPNIVVVLLDDAGYNDLDIPAFGGGGPPKTPTMKALAANGLCLTNFYSYQVCTVSRAALMSGMNPCQFGWQAQNVESDELEHIPLDLKFLPQYLKERGYWCGILGKWHLGEYPGTYKPLARGFDFHAGFYTGTNKGFQPVSNTSRDLYLNDVFWQNPGYVDSIVVDAFTPQLDAITASKRPFFLYFAPKSPHGPMVATEDYAWYNAHYPALTEYQKKRYSMLAKTDRQVKRLRDMIAAAGRMDNTLFVVLSDNGPETHVDSTNTNEYGANTSFFRNGKSYFSMGGLRVPAFVYGPGLDIAVGSTHNLYAITDITRTIIALAGGVVTAPLEGNNVWGTWLDPTVDSPRQFFVAGGLNKTDKGPYIGQQSSKTMIAADRYKIGNAIDQPYQTLQNCADQPYLYNIATDSLETTSIHLTDPVRYNTMLGLLHDYEENHCINEKVGVPNPNFPKLPTDPFYPLREYGHYHY